MRYVISLPSCYTLGANDLEQCCVWFDVLDDIQENL